MGRRNRRARCLLPDLEAPESRALDGGGRRRDGGEREGTRAWADDGMEESKRAQAEWRREHKGADRRRDGGEQEGTG
jgi:hypothetical protein